jgi:hypothetical protein
MAYGLVQVEGARHGLWSGAGRGRTAWPVVWCSKRVHGMAYGLVRMAHGLVRVTYGLVRMAHGMACGTTMHLTGRRRGRIRVPVPPGPPGPCQP